MLLERVAVGARQLEGLAEGDAAMLAGKLQIRSASKVDITGIEKPVVVDARRGCC